MQAAIERRGKELLGAVLLMPAALTALMLAMVFLYVRRYGTEELL